MTEQEREILSRRLEQQSNQQIQKDLGLSVSRVSYVVKKLRSYGFVFDNPLTLKPEVKAELVRLWRANVPAAEIARTLGIQKKTVWTYLGKNGYAGRRKPQLLLQLLDKKEQEWLIAQAVGGLTVNDIIAAIVRDAFAEEVGE